MIIHMIIILKIDIMYTGSAELAFSPLVCKDDMGFRLTF